MTKMKLDGLKNMRAGVRSLKGICLVFVFLMFISSLTSAEFYFETDKRINPDTSNTSQQRNVAMAILNYSGTEYLVAVYQDQSVSLRPVITCKVSSNGGVTWSDDVIISTDTNQQNYDPDVYTMGNYIYVVWTMTKSTGKRATMFAYSANGGVTFSTPIEVNPAGTLDENQPQVAADPYGHVYV
ncbi:MAG: exo-alpha-sialidase, partial [Thermoplasmata archaeon]|nr:exo-alpha-sialidase [Thermoplasmata archaeon]